METNIIISSFCAGIVQTIVGHPLDTIKTRIQIDNNNVRKVLSNIKKNENVLSLYKGGLMPLVGNSILNSFLFTYHYSLNKTINNHYATGLLTGCICGMVLSPFELIKCNLQNNRGNSKNEIVKIIKKIKERKIKLSNGISLSILRDSIGLSIYFGSYEKLQEQNNNPLLNGGIAGSLSWLYSYPIDVLKTKKQVSNDNLWIILKKMKMKMYLNGLSVILLRSFIVNGCIFYTYENLNTYLDRIFCIK
tara:strand:+ start:911 stop:1654 length:744 start_codon:yes stop_codon:yes gene_type:complete